MADDYAISIRGFAEQVGVSHPWIIELIKRGVIPTNPDKTIPYDAGVAAFNRYQAKTKKNVKNNQKQSSDIEESGLNFDQKKVSQLLQVAKMKERAAVAKLKALELQEKEGKLVNVDIVKADISRLSSLVRERLLTIPVRYSALLENKTQREIEAILEEAIDDVMRGFQETKFKEEFSS